MTHLEFFYLNWEICPFSTDMKFHFYSVPSPHIWFSVLLNFRCSRSGTGTTLFDHPIFRVNASIN